MVWEWGMSKQRGPLSDGQKQGGVFLGRDFNRTSEYSAETARLIDSEIKRIIMEQYDRATSAMKSSIDKLHAMAAALLKYETIDRSDIDILMGGGEIPRELPKIRLKTKEMLERERQGEASDDKKGGGLLNGLGDALPEPGAA